MPLSVETVSQDALGLPVSSRALLVARLLASLAGEVNSDVERGHLEEIQKRRAAVKSGQAKLIEGIEGMRQARAALKK